MKKGIIYIGLLLIIITITGCPGAVDSMSWKDLGHGYIYHEPAGIPIIEKEHDEKGIPESVFGYAYNNEFIVVLTKDVQLSAEKEENLIVSGDYYEFVSQNGFSEYWIIAHVNDSLYGPFNNKEYFQKRKYLGVPEDLNINIFETAY